MFSVLPLKSLKKGYGEIISRTKRKLIHREWIFSIPASHGSVPNRVAIIAHGIRFRKQSSWRIWPTVFDGCKLQVVGGFSHIRIVNEIPGKNWGSDPVLDTSAVSNAPLPSFASGKLCTLT